VFVIVGESVQRRFYIVLFEGINILIQSIQALVLLRRPKNVIFSWPAWMCRTRKRSLKLNSRITNAYENENASNLFPGHSLTSNLRSQSSIFGLYFDSSRSSTLRPLRLPETKLILIKVSQHQDHTIYYNISKLNKVKCRFIHVSIGGLQNTKVSFHNDISHKTINHTYTVKYLRYHVVVTTYQQWFCIVIFTIV
jgi:hypothetical protein